MLKGQDTAQYFPKEEHVSMNGVVVSAKARHIAMSGPIGGYWIMANNGHRREYLLQNVSGKIIAISLK